MDYSNIIHLYYLRTLSPNVSWFTLAQDSGRGPSSVCLSLGGASFPCPGMQVIFATTTLTELLYYFFLLRCVYRATHGAHNSSLTLLQLPKPVRFSSYLLPTFLSVVRSLVIPGGVEPPTSPWKGDVLAAWPRDQITLRTDSEDLQTGHYNW